MVLVPPPPPRLLPTVAAGLGSGILAAILVVPAQWAWRASDGQVSSAALHALAIVLAFPLVARFARWCAGEAAPRLVLQGVTCLLPMYMYAVVEGFFVGSRSPIFGYGSLAGDGVAPEVLAGFAASWAGGTLVAWIVDRVRRAEGPVGLPKVVSRAIPWAFVAIAIVILVDGTRQTWRAPTAKEYLASLEPLGGVPAVTLPTAPPNRPTSNPKDSEAYPYRFPDEQHFGLWVARFCSNVSCFVYFARTHFPEPYQTEIFPKERFDLYVSGEAPIDAWRDPARRLLVLRVRHGARTFVDETTLKERYGGKGLTDVLAIPRAMVAVGAAGVLAAIALLLVRSRRERETEGNWRAAQVEGGFLRFDDGTPPVPAPTSIDERAERARSAIGSADGATPHEVLVIPADAESRGAAFRDAGAKTIARAFVGSMSDLAALRESLGAGRRAAAFAVAFTTASPLLFAVGIARGW